MILWHQLLLYLIKHSLNIISVFCFHFTRSRPTAPPTELKLFTERALGPGEAAAAATACAVTVDSITHGMRRSVCILSLNAAIQNCKSNHHSGKTVLQV